MIRIEAMKSGLVFSDPGKQSIPEERRFYRVLRDAPEENERWLAEHISTREIVSFSEEDLERIEAASDDAFCEVELSCLLGRKWRVDSGLGTITGVVREIRSRGFKIKNGAEETVVRMPYAILVDGDEVGLHELRQLEFAE